MIDLGAARFFGEQVDEHEIVVSIPYSPNELMNGKSVDGRVDIYALGMTLLHMLSGLPSWDQPTVTDAATRPLPMIRALGGAPSEEEIELHIQTCLWHVRSDKLRSILKHALADQPIDRYSDIGDFRSELLEWEKQAP